MGGVWILLYDHDLRTKIVTSLLRTTLTHGLDVIGWRRSGGGICLYILI